MRHEILYTSPFVLPAIALTFPVTRLNTAAAMTVDCANEPNATHPSTAVITANINGTHLPSLLSIIGHSVVKTNLGLSNQTKERTRKRLHDGIDDTFVLNACTARACGHCQSRDLLILWCNRFGYSPLLQSGWSESRELETGINSTG